MITKCLELKTAPPQPPKFWLLSKVQFEMVRVPALATPAPFAYPVALPLAIVRPEIAAFAPAFTVNTCTALLPLIVSRFVPGPAIVMLVVIAGSGEARVIVPLNVNVIVLFPPAAFASNMACRNESDPESAVVITVKVAAPTKRPGASKAKKSKVLLIGSSPYRTAVSFTLKEPQPNKPRQV
jgi:hypothetical protein